MAVSVVSTLISLLTLAACVFVLGVAAWLANVIAVACATTPSYVLNRRWVWGRHDASDPWREVVPFWVMAFAGLALSTITVGVVDTWVTGAHVMPALRPLALLAAHLSGFGLLWGVQFVVLDRVLFGGAACPPAA
jgi:putative flippase GtrA